MIRFPVIIRQLYELAYFEPPGSRDAQQAAPRVQLSQLAWNGGREAWSLSRNIR